MKHFISLILIFSFYVDASGQGLINSVQNSNQDLPNGLPAVSCGSFDHMIHIDNHSPGFLNYSNEFMRNLQSVISSQPQKTSFTNVLIVPVVFHIVHNDPSENLPDSVIQNQLDVLNRNFRRQNSDSSNLRPDFANLVGDTHIQFELAKTDPNGNPTTGITRTNTPIQHFGGILPYAANQTQLISDWVNDSLYYNFYRITKDSLGGNDAWDINKYVNIWVGDLRIFEPKINNFEELVFFGLATPPVNHPNFQDSTLNLEDLQQGVLMHYVNIGSNNPNSLPVPYNGYNGLVTEGEMLVHEMGHYLGLRHIWGDGDCTVDDFVHDTPRSSAASQYNCAKSKNTCVDTINGMDLPDMVENFMDYSNSVCKNSFTKGQIDVMRTVLQQYRTQLATIGLNEYEFGKTVLHYPNPTSGIFSIELNLPYEDLEIKIYSLDGKEIHNQLFYDNAPIQLNLDAPKGLYVVRLISKGATATFKIMKS